MIIAAYNDEDEGLLIVCTAPTLSDYFPKWMPEPPITNEEESSK